MKTNHSRPNAALLSTKCKVANAPESILTSPHSLTSARKRSKAPKSKLVSEKANSTSTVHIRDGGSKKKKRPASGRPAPIQWRPLYSIAEYRQHSSSSSLGSGLCREKGVCPCDLRRQPARSRTRDNGTTQRLALALAYPSLRGGMWPRRRTMSFGATAPRASVVSSARRQRPGLRRLASSSRRFPAVSVVAVQDCRCSAPHPFTRHACRMGVDEHLLSQIWESVERRL